MEVEMSSATAATEASAAPEMLGRSQDESEEAAKPKTLSEYVEEELSKSGTCFPFQRRYTILLGMPWLLCGMQTMAHVFVTLPAQRHICVTTFHKGSGASPHCTAVSAGNCTVAKEAAEFDNTAESLVSEFGLICEEEYKVPLLSTGFFLGFLFGVGFFASISDKRGRRTAMLAATLVVQAGAFLAAVAPNYAVYALARICIGAGVGGLGLSSFVWNSEVLGPQSRSILAATTNGTFALGVLLLPPVAYFIPRWRYFSGALFLLGVMLLPLFRLQESPKWYAAVGRAEEAHIVMLRIAAANGMEDPPAPPAPADQSAEKKQLAASSPPRQSILQELLCDSRLSRRFVVMCFTWFSLSVGYYGLSMSVSNLGWDINTAVIVSQLTELPVYFPAIPLVDSKCAGRRGTTVANLLLAGCCCLMAAAASREAAPDPEDIGGEENSASPSLEIICLVYLGKAGVALAFTVVYLYAAELFPIDVRSRAMGLQSLCSRIGGMMAPIIADIGKDSMALALVLFGMPSLLSGLMLLGLPETRGQRIPDSIVDISEPTSIWSMCSRRYNQFDG